MEKDTLKVGHLESTVISTLALIAVILALIVLFLGEDIIQTLAFIYPDWAFPAFFIPWFLLIISTLQKLGKNRNTQRVQIWLLKISIPVFIFTVPFFSQTINGSPTSTTCKEGCTLINDSLVGFEPYCVFIAIIALFLLHFLPNRYLQNQ